MTSSFVVPTDGFFTDVRVSTNLFIPPSPLFAGQVLFDKLTINRLTADFDDDGDVDGDDLTIWKGNVGPTAAADANADGITDGADFLAWQGEFGLGWRRLSLQRSAPSRNQDPLRWPRLALPCCRWRVRRRFASRRNRPQSFIVSDFPLDDSVSPMNQAYDRRPITR